MLSRPQDRDKRNEHNGSIRSLDPESWPGERGMLSQALLPQMGVPIPKTEDTRFSVVINSWFRYYVSLFGSVEILKARRISVYGLLCWLRTDY